MDDWYSVLGITSVASEDEIKKAFRKKVLDFHPDRNPGNKQAEDQFKKIAEAYRILGDPESKKLYDRQQNATSFLAEKFSMTSAAVSAMNEILDDRIFEKLDKILGRVPEPKNIEVKLKITLEELYSGADKEVIFKRNETCDVCQGRGAKTKDDFKICNTCFGLGTAPSIASLFKKKQCQACKGRGRIIVNKCPECQGAGLCKKEVQLIIPIPKDLSFQDKLIVKEEGEGGGNLLIQVETLVHPYFEAAGADLHVEVPISFCQAILGDYLQIDTLKGSAFFKVEEGSQNGDLVILKGYGLKKGEDFGDLIIKLNISIPYRISKEQKQLLEKYKETELKKNVKPKRRNLSKS